MIYTIIIAVMLLIVILACIFYWVHLIYKAVHPGECTGTEIE